MIWRARMMLIANALRQLTTVVLDRGPLPPSTRHVIIYGVASSITS